MDADHLLIPRRGTRLEPKVRRPARDEGRWTALARASAGPSAAADKDGESNGFFSSREQQGVDNRGGRRPALNGPQRTGFGERMSNALEQDAASVPILGRSRRGSRR